jgi:hypothetical protein
VRKSLAQLPRLLPPISVDQAHLEVLLWSRAPMPATIPAATSLAAKGPTPSHQETSEKSATVPSSDVDGVSGCARLEDLNCFRSVPRLTSVVGLSSAGIQRSYPFLTHRLRPYPVAIRSRRCSTPQSSLRLDDYRGKKGEKRHPRPVALGLLSHQLVQKATGTSAGAANLFLSRKNGLSKNSYEIIAVAEVNTNARRINIAR